MNGIWLKDIVFKNDFDETVFRGRENELISNIKKMDSLSLILYERFMNYLKKNRKAKKYELYEFLCINIIDVEGRIQNFIDCQFKFQDTISFSHSLFKTDQVYIDPVKFMKSFSCYNSKTMKGLFDCSWFKFSESVKLLETNNERDTQFMINFRKMTFDFLTRDLEYADTPTKNNIDYLTMKNKFLLSNDMINIITFINSRNIIECILCLDLMNHELKKNKFDQNNAKNYHLFRNNIFEKIYYIFDNIHFFNGIDNLKNDVNLNKDDKEIEIKMQMYYLLFTNDQKCFINILINSSIELIKKMSNLDQMKVFLNNITDIVYTHANEETLINYSKNFVFDRNTIFPKTLTSKYDIFMFYKVLLEHPSMDKSRSCFLIENFKKFHRRNVYQRCLIISLFTIYRDGYIKKKSSICNSNNKLVSLFDHIKGLPNEDIFYISLLISNNGDSDSNYEIDTINLLPMVNRYVYRILINGNTEEFLNPIFYMKNEL